MKHSMKKIFIPVLSVLSGFIISFFAFRANPHLINRVSAGELRREAPMLPQSGLLKKNPRDEIFEEMERMQERMRDHFKRFDMIDERSALAIPRARSVRSSGFPTLSA